MWAVDVEIGSFNGLTWNRVATVRSIELAQEIAEDLATEIANWDPDQGGVSDVRIVRL